MKGTTPPWEMITWPRSLFNLSAVQLVPWIEDDDMKDVLLVVLDSELQMTGNDTSLLVVASGVT